MLEHEHDARVVLGRLAQTEDEIRDQCEIEGEEDENQDFHEVIITFEMLFDNRCGTMIKLLQKSEEED